jgi:hypothetical protein
VGIRERGTLGMSRPIDDGGAPELLGLGGGVPWSRELPVAR